jgi:hypothetical protein
MVVQLGVIRTLACLTQRNEVFKAGASLFGVSDVEALVKDIHKFESRYIDSMIGPYPECKELYRERSPIYHVDKLNCPMIFFQGDEDKVTTGVLFMFVLLSVVVQYIMCSLCAHYKTPLRRTSFH